MGKDNIIESRVKKTLLNARVNLIFYFLTLCLTFFSRKIFLNCLGSSFVGLTSTIGDLLAFLNLAELGVGQAIGYFLYKPLYDHDQEKINEIISVMGYLYRWIGMIILGAGCILACFLPLIFPEQETGFSLLLIFFAYFSFLGSSLIGYFINYRQNLLGADQRNYVVTAYFQTAGLVKTVIQLFVAYYYKSYYLWVAIEFVFGVIYSVILNWKIRQTYPWLKAEISQGRTLFKKYPEVMKKTKQLFIHRIAVFVQFRTAPLLIYGFVSLSIVAYYINYVLVIDKIKGLVNQVMDSSQAAVGNLCAEGNMEKSLKIYWELFSLRLWICFSVAMVLYFCISPFISLWLGQEFILPMSSLCLIIFIACFGIFRGATDNFINAYGLFQDIWAPLIEAILYLGIAIACGKIWGLNGVLTGSAVSLFLVIGVWKPYFLFSRGFHISVWKYWGPALRDIMSICAMVLVFIYFVTKLDLSFNTWSQLILNAILIGFCWTVILCLGLILIEPGQRQLLERILKLKNHEYRKK